MNTSTSDVVLHKGTSLGYFQQLDSKTEYIDLGPAHDNATSHDGCAPNLASPCVDARRSLCTCLVTTQTGYTTVLRFTLSRRLSTQPPSAQNFP